MKYIRNKIWMTIFKFSPPIFPYGPHGTQPVILKVKYHNRKYLLLEVDDHIMTETVYAIYDIKRDRILPPGTIWPPYLFTDLKEFIDGFISLYEEKL